MWLQANVHLLKPGNVATPAAIARMRKISRRSMLCPAICIFLSCFLANDPTTQRERCMQHARTSEFWSERLCHFQSNALLVPVREVGHVHCDRRPVADFDRSIRSLTTAHTFDPVGHMILFWSFPGECCPMRPIDLFRIVADELSLFTIHHIGLSPSVFDGSVTAQNVLAQSKMLVAEGGLPGHNEVVGEI